MNINNKEIIKILKMELLLNNITVLKKYEIKFPNIYEILKKMLYIEPHEGKYPKMGVIFSEEKLDEIADEVLYIKNEDIDLSLRLSDGEKSFLWFAPNSLLNGIMLVNELKINEHDLVLLSKKTESIILLCKDGKIKIFIEGNIYTHENRIWKFKSSIDKKIETILGLTNYKYPQVMLELIKFAYYELSPNKIGSVLVYLLNDEDEKIKELKPPLKFNGYNINLKNKNHHYLVKNFLKQIDGATLILPKGNIWGTGLHLQYTKKSKAVVIEEGGTRHTSAKRFTYDYSNSIVVVTSEDGPVTIYSDGVSIPISTSNIEFENLYPKEQKWDLKEEEAIKSDIATCKKCNKKYRINMIKTGVLDRKKSISCKVCGDFFYKARARIIEYKILK